MIYIKHNMWFYFKHILWFMYNISKNNWIDILYNLLFTYEQNKLNHEKLNYEIIPMYIYILFIVWSQFALSYYSIYIRNQTIKFYTDLKYTYKIQPLQTDCSSNILFSKSDQFLNHIFIAITLYDKQTESNNHILQ